VAVAVVLFSSLTTSSIVIAGRVFPGMFLDFGWRPRVKTQLTMLRFNGLVNRIGGPTDAGELVLV
jgi:hypothetical protein